MKNQINIIVATDQQGGFARAGKIPWRCPDDMKHFKKVSSAHDVVVIGRVTYDDLLDMRAGGDPEKIAKITEEGILPGRTVFVITSSKEQEKFPGATIAANIRAVVNTLDDHKKVLVAGGEALYNEAITWASEVFITIFPIHYGCDRFFPVDALRTDFIITEESEAKKCLVDDCELEVWFTHYQRK